VNLKSNGFVVDLASAVICDYQYITGVPKLWKCPPGGTVDPLGEGASCLCGGNILNEIRAQDKLYIMVGTLLS
jgi:hypothetical protein